MGGMSQYQPISTPKSVDSRLFTTSTKWLYLFLPYFIPLIVVGVFFIWLDISFIINKIFKFMHVVIPGYHND